MSCACEHKRMGQELDRIRRLAKALAKMDDAVVVIYQNADGTYGFQSADNEINKPIIEFITKY